MSPKAQLFDYLSNVFIKRRQRAIYCLKIAELIEN
jgi:hypothetical protein